MDPNYDALMQLLPEQARAWAIMFLQFLTAVALVMPVIDKLVKLTPTKRDDKALEVVQRVLSIFPRVNVPALSKRPPAPAPAPAPVQWPSVDKVAAVLPPEPLKPPADKG